MKAEELYRYNYKAEREFIKSEYDYINYYNEERPHTYLGYLTPNKFEKLYGEKEKNPEKRGSESVIFIF